MKYLSILICAALWPSFLWADTPRPDTLDDTLTLQLEALQADARIIDPVIDPVDKSISFKDAAGGTYTSYPDNLHRQLQSAKDEEGRRQHLEHFTRNAIDGFLAAGEEAPIDTANILPVIRETRFLQDTDLERPVSRPVAGNLSVFLVEDHPTSLSYITAKDLQDINLDLEAAFALAATNQTSREWNPVIEGDGIYFLQLDGTFEASLLLDAALWDFVEEQIGPVLVTVSNRDIVLFGRADDPETRDVLATLAQKYVTEYSYPLSTQLMVRKGSGWEVSR